MKVTEKTAYRDFYEAQQSSIQASFSRREDKNKGGNI